MTVVLAIDQGTSGTKAAVVEESGEILGLSEIPVRPEYLPGGGVEQHPRALLDSVLEAGREAVRRARTGVDVVAFANQGESVLAWDPRTGEPHTGVVVWQDRRAEEICRGMRGSAELFAERTGLVLDPYFSAPKQAWIRRRLTGDGVVTTTDTWLLHRLGAPFVTDVSTASRSLLLDLDAVQWSAELCDRFGLGDEPMPDLVDCDQVVGETAAFGAATPIGGLVVDQQAALAAEGCLEAGDAKCTFGTGAFMLAQSGGEPVRSRSGLSASVAWRTGGETRYCLDGQGYTAASAVRWMQQLGLLGSPAEIDLVAADDAQGVLCVPAFAGLGAPWWRPEASATLVGMRLSTDRSHLVRAVLEGIAAQAAVLGRTVGEDLGRPLRRLRVDGGLTRSSVLMQAVADLMQVPVDVYPSPHATALGAAAFGRAALAPSRGLVDAIVPWRPERSYEPRWSRDRAESFLERWSAVADARGAAERRPSR